MSVLPPVPPVPDLDRYATFTLVSDTTLMSIPFPIYGGQEDVTVTVGGLALSTSAWSLQSASGTSLAQLSLPITDGQALFSPAIPAGSVVEIIGNFQPRQISMPTAPGLARREFNQFTGAVMSGMREMKRLLGITAAPVAMAANASGTLANRSAYDGSVAGFVYLQTDDAGGRPIFYVKNSATLADWSQALIVQASAANGYPVEGRAGYSNAPITLTGTVASQVIIPTVATIASGAFGPNRSLRIKMWGNYTGSPSLAVTIPAAAQTLATLTLPNNSGSAVPFDAEFTIDAVTNTSQVANSFAHSEVTPFYEAQQNNAGAGNFITGNPAVVGLLAQLSSSGNTLIIDRWECRTT